MKKDYSEPEMTISEFGYPGRIANLPGVGGGDNMISADGFEEGEEDW